MIEDKPLSNGMTPLGPSKDAFWWYTSNGRMVTEEFTVSGYMFSSRNADQSAVGRAIESQKLSALANLAYDAEKQAGILGWKCHTTILFPMTSREIGNSVDFDLKGGRSFRDTIYTVRAMIYEVPVWREIRFVSKERALGIVGKKRTRIPIRNMTVLDFKDSDQRCAIGYTTEVFLEPLVNAVGERVYGGVRDDVLYLVRREDNDQDDWIMDSNDTTAGPLSRAQFVKHYHNYETLSLREATDELRRAKKLTDAQIAVVKVPPVIDGGNPKYCLMAEAAAEIAVMAGCEIMLRSDQI